MSIHSRIEPKTDWEAQTQAIEKSAPTIVETIMTTNFITLGKNENDTVSLSVIEISIACFACLTASWVSYPPNSSKAHPGKLEETFNMSLTGLSGTPRKLFGQKLEPTFLLEFITNTFALCTQQIKEEIDTLKPEWLKLRETMKFHETIKRVELNIRYTDGDMYDQIILHIVPARA